MESFGSLNEIFWFIECYRFSDICFFLDFSPTKFSHLLSTYVQIRNLHFSCDFASLGFKQDHSDTALLSSLGPHYGILYPLN